MTTPSGPLLHAFHTVLTEEPCETLKNIFKKLSLGGKKNHRRNPRKLLAYPLKKKAQLFWNSSPIQKYLKNKEYFLERGAKIPLTSRPPERTALKLEPGMLLKTDTHTPPNNGGHLSPAFVILTGHAETTTTPVVSTQESYTNVASGPR